MALICPECGTHTLINDTHVWSPINEIDIVRCQLCGRRFHAKVTLRPVEDESEYKEKKEGGDER